MINVGQIILRLILPLIFGALIFWFKKEKILPLKIYLLFPLFGSLLSIFFLKLFFRYFSKIDPLILPASLILGIFIFVGLLKETKETFTLLMTFLFLTFIGFLIGFGFYEVAIFITLLILILNYFDSYFSLWLKK
jgi:hypothetical protein